jgi:citrate synthase
MRAKTGAHVWWSHSTATPVASTARLAASTTSGPIPSPVINVMRYANRSLLVVPVANGTFGRVVPAVYPDRSDARSSCPATGGDRPQEAGDVTDKGLREVVAADTQISDIDGGLGRLWYVGYDIADLAAHASYEETVYLLHHLDLPTRDQLDELNEFLIDERDLSPFLSNLMHELAQQTSPMSMLPTSISAASAYDPDGWDETAEAQLRKALRLIAKTPTLIANYHRLRTGQDVLPTNPKLPHTANFLWMLLGDEPSAEDADTLDTTFVLYADHTMNASTFTARIIASTLADMFSSVTGAVAALKGPLHGGANEEAMKMLEG